MNVLSIKEHLRNNVSDIIKLLEASNFFHITYNEKRNQIRCARGIDRNKTSIMINCDTLYSQCFSTGISGNIITLIQEHNNLSFIDTLYHIQESLNIDFNTYEKPNYIFGGYFRNVYGLNSSNLLDQIYSEDILNSYSNYPNLMFLHDNISISTQIKYKIGYDSLTGRITVPWRNINGELVGIMGRYNGYIEENKWMPIIPFRKSQVLFGYSENYLSIAKNNIAYIFESEKSVMQLDTYGIYCGLATGGSHISEAQSAYIKALPCEKVILCYDEGLNYEHIKLQANKLKGSAFFMKNIGFIFDSQNKYLPKDSKNSPSDLGKSTFLKLVNNCEVILN